MIWWKEKPDLFQSFKEQLEYFDHLNFAMENEKVVIFGEWPVYGETELIRKYQIRIDIPDDYPDSIPKVFETRGDIPKTLDRHFNTEDKSACLFVKPERWIQWPDGAGIDKFISASVKEFFFSQAFYELTHKWPFGDWKHGNTGIIQFFLLRLKLPTVQILYSFLQYLDSKKPERCIRCPCGSNKRFRQCHWELFALLRSQLPRKEWEDLQKILLFLFKKMMVL
ncbi:SEC-C metal-binding domain-containing protein [Legionella septentrionalis]|uniref:SEC-C metal-binding domain-containing protein n=1 Tax=Legionella septentrionalis TaxID=2498109 RepID=UPI000F8EAD1A|nr:SEC-C metal-binding domain-containing protein [Legionella septentrionalis]RUR14029.1 SEC-C domain-containing protein [Legionella septentrionalis]